MNVVVKTANGSVLTPVYAPEHREAVVAFYSDLIQNNQAMSVKITFDDGEVLHMVEA